MNKIVLILYSTGITLTLIFSLLACYDPITKKLKLFSSEFLMPLTLLILNVLAPFLKILPSPISPILGLGVALLILFSWSIKSPDGIEQKPGYILYGIMTVACLSLTTLVSLVESTSNKLVI